jgi:hypothetical protein
MSETVKTEKLNPTELEKAEDAFITSLALALIQVASQIVEDEAAAERKETTQDKSM